MRYIPRPDCQIPTLADIYEQHLTRHPGRFVEIGAFDGKTVSNTFFLAEAGWHGLYAEPHPDFARLCYQNHIGHPGVTTINVGLSDADGEADLYVVGECSSMVFDKSTIDWGGRLDTKIKVKVTTLNNFLKTWGEKPGFDLLVIDVEQMELRVLAGFDISVWQPHLVIIEAHELDPAPERNFKAKPITQWFTERGYQKIYRDAINSIFVRAH